MADTPHEFTHDAWEANAEVWDARMGDDGNDFFKTHERPSLAPVPCHICGETGQSIARYRENWVFNLHSSLFSNGIQKQA